MIPIQYALRRRMAGGGSGMRTITITTDYSGIIVPDSAELTGSYTINDFKPRVIYEGVETYSAGVLEVPDGAIINIKIATFCFTTSYVYKDGVEIANVYGNSPGFYTTNVNITVTSDLLINMVVPKGTYGTFYSNVYVTTQ